MTYKRSAASHYKQGRIENVQATGRRSKGTRLAADQKLMDRVEFRKPTQTREPAYTVELPSKAEVAPAQQESINEKGVPAEESIISASEGDEEGDELESDDDQVAAESSDNDE